MKEKSNKILNIRITPTAYNLISSRAETCGVTISTYCRKVLSHNRIFSAKSSKDLTQCNVKLRRIVGLLKLYLKCGQLENDKASAAVKDLVTIIKILEDE